MPRLRYSLLSIFLLTALVAVGLLMYQQYLGLQKAEEKLAFLLQVVKPEAKELNDFTSLINNYPRFATRPECLIFAASHGDPLLCRRMIQLGADPNAPSPKDGLSPLAWAVMYRKADVTAELIDQGARLDRFSVTQYEIKPGDTLLHLAGIYGTPDVVDVLVARGCPVDTKNSAGITPLEQALETPYPRMVRAFLKNGASLPRDKQGRMPLEAMQERLAAATEGSQQDIALTQAVWILKQYEPIAADLPTTEDSP